MSLLAILALITGFIAIFYGLNILLKEQDSFKQYKYIKNQEKLSIEEVKNLYQTYLDRMKIGLGFGLLVELEGKGKFSNQLISPVEQKSCIYYSLKITQKVQFQASRKIFEEVIFKQEKWDDFFLKDDTNEILIKTDRIPQKFWHSIRSPILRKKQNKLPESWNIKQKLPEGTVLFEYLLEEQIVALENEFYVFGEVNDYRGVLAVDNSLHQGFKLWIAPQSKKDFLADIYQGFYKKFTFASFFLFFGMILILLGFWAF